jgi:hypothetical protein
MNYEPWARVSLRIACNNCSVEDVATRLNLASEDNSPDFWAADLGGGSSIPLSEQLVRACLFMRANQAALASLGGSNEINLHVGWTPRNPQDGIAFNGELIRVLAECRAYVLLDTYQD